MFCDLVKSVVELFGCMVFERACWGDSVVDYFSCEPGEVGTKVRTYLDRGGRSVRARDPAQQQPSA